jgi:type III pantothenate kinase
MLLAVDVGNTHAVFGFFESDALLADFRIASQPARTADEWGSAIRQLCSLRKIDLASVSAAVVCSVVPPLTGTVLEGIQQYLGITPLVVGPGVKTGIPIQYDPPQDVGADRIVNAVAAHHRSGGAAIVVDFGTATTFDVISAKGEYLGGAIAPGIQIAADALFTRAARLPRVEVRKPPDVVGRNTVHSIQSGLYYGYVALVNGMLARMRRSLSEEPQVYVTGGLGSALAPDLEGVAAVLPHLTLEGLRLIYLKNRT